MKKESSSKADIEKDEEKIRLIESEIKEILDLIEKKNLSLDDLMVDAESFQKNYKIPIKAIRSLSNRLNFIQQDVENKVIAVKGFSTILTNSFANGMNP